MTSTKFIPRKFKNIESNHILDFHTLVHNSSISVILGEPASGKTFQLKEYSQNKNSKLFLLKMLSEYKKKDIKEYEILLLDSIDEALLKNKDDDILIHRLVKFVEHYKKKKIIITCRYLEWKENFEEKLKEVDKELKVYDIQELSKDDINLLLKDNDINDFWDFIEKNHLELLLKNIMIVKHLTSNFNKEYQQKNISYIDIYEKIVEQSIKTKGEDRKHKHDKRKVKKLFPIGASLATYMMLNRKDTVLNENINDIENFVDELYQVENKDIKDNDLEKILDTALFEKKGDEFSFFHKSIQEYLTAYFISYKKLDSETIKRIFSHKLRFYEEFEEVIIYLTNIQPHLFNDLVDVDFDPFIFRRHPYLDNSQQERLLLSIINKLQKNEAFAWDRVNFFYNSSLVKFDKLDIYPLIKDKNIENSQSDILLQYIMRVFTENYSKEFEDYIFKILSENLKDKIKCSKLIGYSYNIDYRYNLALFSFMKENQLFFIEEDRNINSYIIEKLFLILYGFKFQHNNYNQIIGRDNKDYDVEKVVDLLPFIKYESFVEITSSFITLADMGVWFKHILKTYKYEKLLHTNRNYHDNIGWMLYKILNEFILFKETMMNIIVFVQKNQISIKPPSFQKYKQLPTSLLFYPISNDFWELYFSDKIQSFGEIERFLGFYHIQKSDIIKMQRKYLFEDNFVKTLHLLEYLNNRHDNDEEFLVLEKEQLEKVVSKLEYKKEDNKLAETILKLFKFNYSKKLEELVFKILTQFVKDKEKCRKYIRLSYNIKYNYNVQLFYFMKKYNLFGEKERNPYSYEKKSPELEINLFFILYGFNSTLHRTKNDFSFIDLMTLSKTIRFIDFSLEVVNKIDIFDIEKWFLYLSQNFEKDLFFKQNMGWLINNILLRSKNIPLKQIINLMIKTQITIPKNVDSSIDKEDKNLINAIPLFYMIKNEFWAIYFSTKINNIEEIKSFISFYYINERDLKEAIKKYPIEDNIEKYYGLGVKYNFIDILIGNEKYREYVEHKQEEKESLDDYYEKKYLNKIIQIQEDKKYLINIKNYTNKNILDIFYYAFNQKKNFKETDKKLREDLNENYIVFINNISTSYFSLKKEYYDNCSPRNKWIYNYLFNILSTKEKIDNILISDKNYEKLFWYIILGCISTDNECLFGVIKDKFKLFINTVIELNAFSKNDNHCYLSWEYNTFISPCRRIIDILEKIDFDKKSDIWINFIEYLKKEKEENSQYKKFFELIEEINKEPITIEISLLGIEKNDEESFTYFTFMFREDINKALEYFYKYIYDPIPYTIIYSNEKKSNSLYNINSLNYRYFAELTSSFKDKKSSSYSSISEINLTVEERESNNREALKQKFKNFYKDKNCSYNIAKIILFDKLLKQFGLEDSKKLGKLYIKKILIDYYKFFKEEKTPLAKDYVEINNNFSPFFQTKEQSSAQLIVELWGLLQSDKKYTNLLEELKDSDNNYISDSAEYCLLKIYEKQGEDRDFGDEYYKNILDRGMFPINTSLDLFEIIKEIWDKDIRNWLEKEGAYKFINELSQKENNKNAEDFIQKTIISEIKLGFLRREHKEKKFSIKREEQKLDDKRLDFTISYPPFGSIVIELKLAHNDEVKFKQNNEPTKKAKDYIDKLEQYIKGSQSNFALFVIFNIEEDKRKKDLEEQIDNLNKIYKEHTDIAIIGLNCVK